MEELRNTTEVLDAIKRVTMLCRRESIREEQWKVAKALFRVLSRALAELQLVFARARGVRFC